ncbi:MAG: CoA-binding protein, partial [Dehalococcoidales bacterium]
MNETTTSAGTFTAEGAAVPSETAASLDVFFKPCSVAVIGASRRAGTIGNHLFRNLLREDFAGVVHPVNANAESVASVKA